jgi:hypothetical protein
MKKFSINLKTIGKVVLPAAFVALTLGSCSKKDLGIPPASQDNSVLNQKAQALRTNVYKVLKGFVTAQAGGSNQQSFAASGGTNFSNCTMSTTTHSQPNRMTTTWSDPTTPGTSYSFSESASGGSGGGLGQLSYNGKSFDYGYVLSIRITSADPSWGSIATGPELRALVAIDGDLEGEDFTIRNLAIFLTVGSAGQGTFEFNAFDNPTFTDGFAIGELLDFSDVASPTLDMMDNAKFYYTSGGHVDVSDAAFEMGSDAKIKDVDTGVEYSIEGAVMAF